MVDSLEIIGEVDQPVVETLVDAGGGEDVLDHIQEYAPLYVMLLMPWDIYSYNY